MTFSELGALLLATKNVAISEEDNFMNVVCYCRQTPSKQFLSQMACSHMLCLPTNVD